MAAGGRAGAGAGGGFARADLEWLLEAPPPGAGADRGGAAATLALCAACAWFAAAALGDWRALAAAALERLAAAPAVALARFGRAAPAARPPPPPPAQACAPPLARLLAAPGARDLLLPLLGGPDLAALAAAARPLARSVRAACRARALRGRAGTRGPPAPCASVLAGLARLGGGGTALARRLRCAASAAEAGRAPLLHYPLAALDFAPPRRWARGLATLARAAECALALALLARSRLFLCDAAVLAAAWAASWLDAQRGLAPRLRRAAHAGVEAALLAALHARLVPAHQTAARFLAARLLAWGCAAAAAAAATAEGAGQGGRRAHLAAAHRALAAHALWLAVDRHVLGAAQLLALATAAALVATLALAAAGLLLAAAVSAPMFALACCRRGPVGLRDLVGERGEAHADAWLPRLYLALAGALFALLAGGWLGVWERALSAEAAASVPAPLAAALARLRLLAWALPAGALLLLAVARGPCLSRASARARPEALLEWALRRPALRGVARAARLLDALEAADPRPPSGDATAH